MIESIHIADCATYSLPADMIEFGKFNFFFGTNGTGKTTISKVIADEGNYPRCRISWRGGTKLQTVVYNRDFIEKNFNQCTELKGIFTLGEKHADTLSKIADAKGQLDELVKRIQDLTRTLQGEDGKGGKKGELAALEAELKEKCWAQKVKYDAKLAGAFEGYRNNSEKFKGKILQEYVSNTATLKSLADLENRAETLYGPPLASENLISNIETSQIVAYEEEPILKKRILGKGDVDIAAMIQKLGNSDWVKEGRAFYEVNDKVCPFCQQKTPDSFVKSLNDYFDEAYETDSAKIDSLLIGYKTEGERLQKLVASIIEAPSKFLDVEKLKDEKALLDSKLLINIQRITEKKKEPSQVATLELISNVLASIKAVIDGTNAKITSHNKLVSNFAKEKAGLTMEVWKYLLENGLKSDLATYKTKKEGLDKAIESLTKQISDTGRDRDTKATEIRDLEKTTTSIQPTIDGMNGLLSSFGFRNFKLAKTDNGTCYKLLRSDGTDAKETLSEGERAFVTFIYFYYLLRGSNSESGVTTDRVVVFDDPVSSFDSDILFIVASLIKGIFEEIRAGIGQIKQVFVLTHNAYFHREVTFTPRLRKEATGDRTFWVVRKPDLVSKIEKHPSNPIKTSYELLWAELRKPDLPSLTIQNIMRRILENYFKILGNEDFDSICDKFDGNDRLICKSLFSWVHSGSHYIYDELCVSAGDSATATYLTVFKSIFEKMDHPSHYNMMMKEG